MWKFKLSNERVTLLSNLNIDSSNKLNDAKTLSSALADRICEKIISKKLVPGSHLGTESKIAEQYGVSRTVVREAIGTLKGLGVVSGRQGRGLMVTQGDIQSILRKVLAPRAVEDNGWLEFGRFRMVIELGAMPMVVQYATPAHIARLKSLSAEMRELVERVNEDPAKVLAAFTEKDASFHETILSATGSDLVAQFHQMLVVYFQSNQQFLKPPNLRMVQEHEQIIEAIEKGDALQAVEIMNRHLQPMMDFLKRCHADDSQPAEDLEMN